MRCQLLRSYMYITFISLPQPSFCSSVAHFVLNHVPSCLYSFKDPLYCHTLGIISFLCICSQMVRISENLLNRFQFLQPLWTRYHITRVKYKNCYNKVWKLYQYSKNSPHYHSLDIPRFSILVVFEKSWQRKSKGRISA